MGCLTGEPGKGSGIDMGAPDIMNGGVLPPGQHMALGGAGIDLNEMVIDEDDMARDN